MPTIIEVARTLTRSVPPPRGAPYFCLDTEAAYDLRLLDALSERGIFRKYEFALDLGSGLGGRARWLAARSGCRIAGIDPRPAAVAAAATLNRRARMDEQVSFAVGQLEKLPLRERVFTHVWLVDPAREVHTARVLAEAFRVLRRGAHFGLQCSTLAPAARDVMLDALRHVGFIDIEMSAVSFVEMPHACRMARARFSSARQELDDAGSPPAELVTQAEHRARLQIFARRPA